MTSKKAREEAAIQNRILPGIQSFAWNPDRSLVAVCPYSREILIFATNQKPDIKDWRLVEVLKEHYSNVNSLEWHPVTNQLLSSSTDRGIIVWNPTPEGRMLPNLCAVKELKANLFASWNGRGDKFCVGGSSGHVFIGTYNEALNFWVALSQTEEPPLGKPLHKASVTTVRFDPGSGRAVASSSADGTVVVSSAYKEEIDNDGVGPFAGVTAEAGEIIFKLKTNVWNNTLAFSPSGATLAFASHDCEMHFTDFTADQVASKTKPAVKRTVYNGNPILTGLFISENTYIGCGFDNAPLLFKRQEDGSWTFEGSIDPGFGKKKASRIGSDAFGGRTVFFDNVNLDQNTMMMPKQTLHQNYINDCQAYVKDGNGNVQVLTTCDPNGSINYWNVAEHI